MLYVSIRTSLNHSLSSLLLSILIKCYVERDGGLKSLVPFEIIILYTYFLQINCFDVFI